MKIAIVILNWNGKELLAKFLPKIIRYSDPTYCDIYVADNASTDNSVAYIKQNFKEVKIVQNNANYGYAEGYNQALKNINTDILALVNSDIEVTKNWLKPIIETFKKNENTAIIQPKILDFKDKTKFEYAGAGGGFIDNLGYPFCRGRIFGELETDIGQYDDEINIFWASGACMFIRKTVFNDLKFDGDYFAHQEEIDLCWRAQNLGFEVKYNGKSTVYHVGGATLNEGSPKKTYLNFRNNLITLIKNLPKNKVFIIVFVRLFLDGLAGIKFLLEGKPLHTIAIIKAHFNMYFNLRRINKKRAKISTKKETYFKTKNIVKQHFISKVKTFDKII